jgi:hypothetical protein
MIKHLLFIYLRGKHERQNIGKIGSEYAGILIQTLWIISMSTKMSAFKPMALYL